MAVEVFDKAGGRQITGIQQHPSSNLTAIQILGYANTSMDGFPVWSLNSHRRLSRENLPTKYVQ